MNILKKLFSGLFILISVMAMGQNNYILDLKAENWNIKPGFYKFSEINDDRNNKSSAGKLHSGDKLVTVNFPHSLQSDLKKLIDESIIQDTSFVPISISVERFTLMETGSVKNHKITLDFSLKFYRILNQKQFKLYEAKGKPEMVLQGVFPKVPETLIRVSLENIFKNFNEWINQNNDLPSLANKVIVIYENDTDAKSRDTIFWNNNYKLKWNDFKGSPGATNFMALSNCIFSYRALPKSDKGILELHIHLNACFDRNRSWVKPNQEKDTLLAHEQLHFDICELNIRHLRKRILDSDLDPIDFDKQINTLFNEVWNEYQEQQQRYDEETGHGIIADKQQMWQTDIHSQLKNFPSEK